MEKEVKRKINKVKKQLMFKGYVFGAIICFLVILIAFNAIFAWGIYKLDWQNLAVEKIVEILPYPAAKVNQQYVSFYDYLKNLKALQTFYDKQKKAGSPAIPTDLELKKMALEQRLINNILIKNIAEQYGVRVEDEEVDDELDNLIKQKGGEEEFEKSLKEFYDLNIQEYGEYFIRPDLVFNKTEAIVEAQGLSFIDLIKTETEKAQIEIYVY